MIIEFKSLAGIARQQRNLPANRLLAALYALGGGHGALLRHNERAWASVTFSGCKHSVTFRFCGAIGIAAGEAFIEALPEHEFTIAGQLVADAAVTAARHALLPEPSLEVECEILMLDEG